MNEMQPTNSNSPTKWIVFVLGSLFVVPLLAVVALVLFTLPVVQKLREGSRRQAAAENLKGMELALRNYQASMVVPNANNAQSPAVVRTVDAVRQIVSTQLGVDVKQITERTSLADLGADDLDLVELVMELEEHFSISIPEESIVLVDAKTATEKLFQQSQFGELTMLRLAEIVDQRCKAETQIEIILRNWDSCSNELLCIQLNRRR